VVEKAADQTQEHLNEYDIDNQFVDHSFKVAQLLATVLGVEEDLGLISGVAAHGHHPIGVLEVGSFQEKLLLGQGKFLFADAHRALERMQIVVGVLKGDIGLDLEELFGLVQRGLKVFVHIFGLYSLLQILLAI